MPCLFNSCTKTGLTLMGCGALKYCVAINPPITMPTTKNKFHNSFFQSYLKNSMFPGINAAHTCRNVDEMPKRLLPNTSSNGTIKPIRRPVTYQGQGCLINSIITLKIYFQKISIKNVTV